MLPRFQHVLVPVDFTEKNLAALDIAFDIAVQNKASVTLLHVIETLDFEDDAEIDSFYNSLERRAAAELDRMSQRFVEAHVRLDWKVRFGKRAAEIVQFSIDRDVDLIVMSSHKVDLNGPQPGWGTLSHQVSILCQCPVLLVK